MLEDPIGGAGRALTDCFIQFGPRHPLALGDDAHDPGVRDVIAVRNGRQLAIHRRPEELPQLLSGEQPLLGNVVEASFLDLDDVAG